MSIWTILLREAVKDAIVEAIRTEFGQKADPVIKALNNPEAIGEAIIKDTDAMRNIRIGLATIIRAVIGAINNGKKPS